MCFAGKVWVGGLIVAFDGFDGLLVLVMRFVMFVVCCFGSLQWVALVACFSLFVGIVMLALFCYCSLIVSCCL